MPVLVGPGPLESSKLTRKAAAPNYDTAKFSRRRLQAASDLANIAHPQAGRRLSLVVAKPKAG